MKDQEQTSLRDFLLSYLQRPLHRTSPLALKACAHVVGSLWKDLVERATYTDIEVGLSAWPEVLPTLSNILTNSAYPDDTRISAMTAFSSGITDALALLLARTYTEEGTDASSELAKSTVSSCVVLFRVGLADPHGTVRTRAMNAVVHFLDYLRDEATREMLSNVLLHVFECVSSRISVAKTARSGYEECCEHLDLLVEVREE